MIDEKLDQNDVVISSRIRLARNIADFPFVSTCSNDQRAEIEAAVRTGLSDDDQLKQLAFVDSIELESLERQFLLQLQLVSKVSSPTSMEETVREDSLESTLSDSSEASESVNRKSVDEAIFPVATSSLTINDEDHLRITVTRNDLDLVAAWDQINQLDDRIEQHLNYAFSPRWGYLTACPANVGTGMRISVLVHLPALAMTGQIDKVFRGLQRLNVATRGVFGDKAVGDFFRIGNQATLGVDEAKLIEQVASVIPALVQYERQAREFLLIENREGLRRDVAQALEKLCQCDLNDNHDDNLSNVIKLLSKVRMGVAMGLLGQTEADRVNRLFAIVQLRHRLEVAVAREDYSLASQLRDRIEQLENGHWDPHVFDQDASDEGDSL